MTWTQLTLKEWQRRPLRTSITAVGVGIATAALFSLLAFQRGYREGMHQELERLGAHILLVPKGCPYDAASMALHGASWPCFLKQRYLDEVRSVPGVAAVAPVFMSAVYDTDGTQAVYVGVDKNMLALKNGWRLQGAFPELKGQLLAGAEAARRHKWVVGQTVSLPGLNGQTAVVAGTLAPTQGAEDAFIYLRLTDAQQKFHHMNELTHILVHLARPEDLDKVASQLRGCDAGLAMNVVPLAHVFRTIQSLVNVTRLWLGCIAVVALLVAGTGVSNTVLMAVNERRREIGVMRALGASRNNIFRLVWQESVQTCLSGGLVGVVAAFLASRWLEAWVRTQLPFSPTDCLIRWEWWLAGCCVAAAAGLGSLAGFLPAWRAASVPPMTAIRTAGGGTWT
jgi:putative ABC transport system permease protein